ncbi:histidine phosphatase family protein [Mycolicibacter terrae]|uniref:Phosphoglycerate mutase n=2 Tax=Mycolicibacter TaxID=1073531 RepID=A0A1A2NK01_MYCSD|nr:MULTISPECIES: histidine phosphatase family protein [Mycolicibacter]OBH15392.1 phosphoglycerate mutase [Mycolicibacter sinensis]OBI25420.1 phosphoglycerate mutase [Mycolicibacter sinensis]RRR44717.1 histidine phosphatase family protein [Mycolicibacter terrae]
MQRLLSCSGIAAGIPLVAAGVITPVTAPPAAAAQLDDIRLTATDITLDLVRHGESTDDANGILGTLPPGAHLTELGDQQAVDVAKAIQQEFPDGIAGIYASQLVRTQETADPLAQALGLDVQILPGLNEIPAGFLEGQPRDLVTEIGYFGPMAAWVLGLLFVPEIGSINGVQFDEQVDDAIGTIYDNTLAGNGPLTDVAYSSGGPIAIWALMNVKNPPIFLLAQQLLQTLGPPPNAGQAILQGNPTDGWTMLSWDGTPVVQTPDLLTGLFVDYRDLVTAPQIALWNIWEAILGGNSADIATALQTGFNQVVAAVEAFPQAVIDTITGAMGDAAGSSAGDALAALAG